MGGYEKQYQVEVDPRGCGRTDIPVTRMMDAAIGAHNAEIGARVLEMGGREYMIRGLGYAGRRQDIEDVAVGATPAGTPIRVRDVADRAAGPRAAAWRGRLRRPRARRWAGIVVMRFDADALKTIEAVKARIEEIQAGLPRGRPRSCRSTTAAT